MVHAEQLRLLAFAGSLRQKSMNKGLLRAAVEVQPPDLAIDIFDLAPLPFYNADVEAQGDPETVREFKEKITAADGLLIAVTEYNYSVSGVLKNAIDWASRFPGRTPLNGKPVAMMGASTGNFGTARAQLNLRQSFVLTDSPVLQKPEIYAFRGGERFDENGNLVDDTTRQMVRDLLTNFAGFIRLHQAARPG